MSGADARHDREYWDGRYSPAQEAEILNELTIRDADVDFSKYLDPEDVAKLRDVFTYRNAVADELTNPAQAQGARLPWAKADAFRFRKSELTIWTGYNGHKKSMLLGYVMVGLLSQDQTGCIASLEMPPRKTLLRMCRQWIGNSDPTLAFVDKFFDWAKGKLWLYDQVGTVKPDKLVAVTRYAATMLGVEHFVIDSLMKCGVSIEDLDRQKRFVDQLAAVAKDTGCHVHLVAHARKPEGGKELVPSTKYGVKGASEITDMADNVLVVHCNKDETRDPARDVGLICEKQRHGESEPKYWLNFDDNGLQFKSRPTAMRMGPEDWNRQAWR